MYTILYICIYIYIHVMYVCLVEAKPARNTWLSRATFCLHYSKGEHISLSLSIYIYIYISIHTHIYIIIVVIW